MKTKIIHTPDGVRDWLPAECSSKGRIIEGIENTFISYGYKKLESPIFEFEDVFSQTNMSQNRLYRFTDEKGESLALRADMTPPIVRIACTAYKNEQCHRFFYSGNIFTIKKNLQGKLKESSQTGIELMGINSAEADAESVEITIKSLESAGVKDFLINIGHVDFIKGILMECGLDSESKILELIDNTDYVGIQSILQNAPVDAELKKILENIPLLIGKINMLHEYKNKVTNETSVAALNRLINIYEILKDSGLEHHITFDLGMVSNLSYYTGVVFRAYAFGTGFPVASGGRYDNLAANFGKEMPSVGVSMKINNIMDVVYGKNTDIEQNKKSVLLCNENQSRSVACKIANSIRQKGIIVEKSLVCNEERLNYAKQKNINTIMEIDESIKILNVQSGEQKMFSANDIDKIINLLVGGDE